MAIAEQTPLRSRLHLLYWLLGYKIAVLILLACAIVLLPPLFSLENYYANLHGPSAPGPWSRYFSTWDTQGYLMISEYGYGVEQPLAAYFPLWPFCVRLFSYLTGGDHLLAGTILANLMSIFGLLALYELILLNKDQGVADRTLLLMLAFPGALFFLFPYTEALFLLVSVMLFYHMSKGNYWIAGIFGFFAALARPVGILLAIPLALHILKKRKFPALVSIAFPMAGYLVYLLILKVSTGDAFSGFAAQKLFISQASVLRIFDIPGFLQALASPELLHGFSGSVIDRVWFVLLCISLPLIWKMNTDWFFYSLLVGFIPAMSNQFVSFTRYSLVIFPLFIAVAQVFSTERMTRWFNLLLFTLFGIQIIFLVLHINFYWAG